MVCRKQNELSLSDRAAAELLRDIFEAVGVILIERDDYPIDWSEGYAMVDQEALNKTVMKECYRLLNLNYHKGN